MVLNLAKGIAIRSLSAERCWVVSPTNSMSRTEYEQPTDISGRETAQKIERGSRTEKGSFGRMASIALNALAAFSVGMLSVVVN